MTELLETPVEVRCADAGGVVAVRAPGGAWRTVERTLNRWRVETDWWREPVAREYHRCLLTPDRPAGAGECVELHHDLVAGRWMLSRRYD